MIEQLSLLKRHYFTGVFTLARFQLILGDPETGNSFKKLIDSDEHTRALIGLRIGEEVDGENIGFEGYNFVITGGSDKDGFPMHPSVPTNRRKLILTKGGIGFRGGRPGQRRRKRVHGAIISEDSYQVNMKILAKGKKPIEELL